MAVTGHSCVNDGGLRKLRDAHGFPGPPGFCAPNRAASHHAPHDLLFGATRNWPAPARPYEAVDPKG